MHESVDVVFSVAVSSINSLFMSIRFDHVNRSRQKPFEIQREYSMREINVGEFSTVI